MRPALRAFLALPLPTDLCQALAHAAGTLDGLRSQRLGTIHLTVRFLGDIENPEPILDAVRPVAAATPPFEFALRGLGAFPRLQRARVVWAGVEAGAEEAAALAAGIEKALRPLGFQPEGRPWRAHVTVGRFKVPRSLELPASLAGREWGVALAERLVLYRSELTPQGARHEVAGKLSLGGGM